jgi:hypothetical protein
MYHATSLPKIALFWEVAPCTLVQADYCLLPPIIKIALMMEAVSTSETSVNIYQTARRNIPEETRLHTRRCENLKPHHNFVVCGKPFRRDSMTPQT